MCFIMPLNASANATLTSSSRTSPFWREEVKQERMHVTSSKPTLMDENMRQRCGAEDASPVAP